jgi:type I restriction enzyme S subunit
VNWPVDRLGRLATAWPSNVDKHSVEGQSKIRLCNYTDVYNNRTITDRLPFMRATASEEQINRFRIRLGDTLITKDSETADDIGVPSYVAYEADDLVCGYHLAIVRPDESTSHPRYVYWALASTFVSMQWAVLASGVTRVGIRSSDLMRVRIPIPPLEKQATIADYLDRETAQIDTLIAKQEQLVGRLRQRRHAEIVRGASQGVDGGPLKASSLGWSNHICAAWEELNLRRVATMKTGHTPSRAKIEYWENTTIPWFTLADVWQLRDGTRMYLGETANRISELGLANSAAELLPAGTVVLSRTASVGFSGIMPVPMATSQDFWNWVCSERLEPEFLVYVFRAMRGYFASLMMGSTHQTIYQPVAAALRIPLPPLDEQRRIVAYLDEQTAKIDALIAKAERFIELAKERRAALITAAVTGQLDVTAA